MSLSINIDGKACTGEIGETLLAVAQRNGLVIPTLCHSKALPGQGCCRVCMVEIDEGMGPRMVAACVHKLTVDAVVDTSNDKVQRVRKVNLALVRARAPQSEAVLELCRQYEVEEKPKYVGVDTTKCILCGLCVQACSLNGTSAISISGRGVGKKISTPYEKPSAYCIGCGSCSRICPCEAIELKEEGGKRRIWDKDFTLVACKSCGKYFATPEELLHSQQKSGAEQAAVYCEECRRSRLSDKVWNLVANVPHCEDY